MLFAGDESQQIVMKYYAHITHQKGAWIPEKDSILLAPRELAYVDLCVSPALPALIQCECIRIPLQLINSKCCIANGLSLCFASKQIP